MQRGTRLSFWSANGARMGQCGIFPNGELNHEKSEDQAENQAAPDVGSCESRLLEFLLMGNMPEKSEETAAKRFQERRLNLSRPSTPGRRLRERCGQRGV